MVVFDLIEDIIVWIEDISKGNILVAALLAGSICMFMTLIGSLPALLGRRITDKMIDVGLGFSAGIMLVASFTSLILPGIEMGGIDLVIPGFILGTLVIYLIDKILPHEHIIKGYEGPPHLRRRIKAVWLIVFAIIIHNIPEGLAVGAAITYSIKYGVLLAIAIGIQDIPEGLAVAIPLISIGMKTRIAIGIAFLSGLIELIGAVLLVFVMSFSKTLLPIILGFAGGAMIYVVSHEVIPETHRHGYEEEATLGFLIGFMIMLILDTLL